jgi:hypothetical protein
MRRGLAVAPQEHGVGLLGERRKHGIGHAALLDYFRLQLSGEQALACPVEHRRSVRPPGLAHMGDEDGAVKPLAQHYGLFERRVRAWASVEAYQQAREHD